MALEPQAAALCACQLILILSHLHVQQPFLQQVYTPTAFLSNTLSKIHVERVAVHHGARLTANTHHTFAVVIPQTAIGLDDSDGDRDKPATVLLHRLQAAYFSAQKALRERN